MLSVRCIILLITLVTFAHASAVLENRAACPVPTTTVTKKAWVTKKVWVTKNIWQTKHIWVTKTETDKVYTTATVQSTAKACSCSSFRSSFTSYCKPHEVQPT
jgi:uncharacterized protein YpuA (DUF1002 family)